MGRPDFCNNVQAKYGKIYNSKNELDFIINTRLLSSKISVPMISYTTEVCLLVFIA